MSHNGLSFGAAEIYCFLVFNYEYSRERSDTVLRDRLVMTGTCWFGFFRSSSLLRFSASELNSDDSFLVGTSIFINLDRSARNSGAHIATTVITIFSARNHFGGDLFCEGGTTKLKVESVGVRTLNL